MPPLKTLVLAILLMPVTTFAQDGGGLGQDKQRSLIQAAEQMRACFNNVDQQELRDLQQKAEAIESKLRGLCESGQRVQAQNEALLFSQEFARSPSVEQLRRCGDIGKAMIPDIPEFDDPETYKDRHICDTLGSNQ